MKSVALTAATKLATSVALRRFAGRPSAPAAAAATSRASPAAGPAAVAFGAGFAAGAAAGLDDAAGLAAAALAGALGAEGGSRCTATACCCCLPGGGLPPVLRCCSPPDLAPPPCCNCWAAFLPFRLPAEARADAAQELESGLVGRGAACRQPPLLPPPAAAGAGAGLGLGAGLAGRSSNPSSSHWSSHSRSSFVIWSAVRLRCCRAGVAPTLPASAPSSLLPLAAPLAGWLGAAPLPAMAPLQGCKAGVGHKAAALAVGGRPRRAPYLPLPGRWGRWGWIEAAAEALLSWLGGAKPNRLDFGWAGSPAGGRNSPTPAASAANQEWTPIGLMAAVGPCTVAMRHASSHAGAATTSRAPRGCPS